MTAPWPGVLPVKICLVVFGLIGTAYVAVVTRRARRQRTYAPVFEDWLFHTLLPFAAYIAIVASAFGVSRPDAYALFVVGGAAILLIYVSIHNAWDTVTFVVLSRWRRQRAQKAAPKAEEAISYGMPAFKLNGLLVWFAAYAKHIGFYPRVSAIAAFKKELSIYKGAKGSVQFPLDKPLPLALITRIVKFRAKENRERQKAKS